MNRPMPNVRHAKHSDVERVIKVHKDSFEGFFLTSLGPHFLRLFYCGLIDQEPGRLLVSVDGDEVLGFVGGATEQVEFYSRLLRERLWGFVIASALAVVRRPRAFGRLVRARGRASGQASTPPGACLMSLGVSPSAEGFGVGRALVTAFAEEVERAGARDLLLTT